MGPEEGKVNDGGPDNKTKGAGGKVTVELLNAQALADVEELPKVDQDSDADSQECEQSNHLATQGAGEESTSGKEPTPPSRGELMIAKLAELNVGKERKCHEENEGGVEEDQTRLGNMSVVKKNESSGERGNGGRVARLFHDPEDDWDGGGAQEGGERAHADEGHLVDGITVADVGKIEFAIESNEPADKAEEELGERWVHVEVILAENVVGGELAKVNLVENDLVGMVDLVESESQSHYEQRARNDPAETESLHVWHPACAICLSLVACADCIGVFRVRTR